MWDRHKWRCWISIRFQNLSFLKIQIILESDVGFRVRGVSLYRNSINVNSNLKVLNFTFWPPKYFFKHALNPTQDHLPFGLHGFRFKRSDRSLVSWNTGCVTNWRYVRHAGTPSVTYSLIAEGFTTTGRLYTHRFKRGWLLPFHKRGRKRGTSLPYRKHVVEYFFCPLPSRTLFRICEPIETVSTTFSSSKCRVIWLDA